MAQLVGHLTLGFGSGHDLVVCEVESRVGLCTGGTEPVWDPLSLSLSLSLSLPAPPPLTLMYALSQNK